MKRKIWLAWVCCVVAVVANGRSETEDEKFLGLVDRIWSWNLEQFPERCAYLGKREGLDRWTDRSFEAIEARKAKTREFLAELEAMDRDALSDRWKLDYDLLLRDYRQSVEGQRFPDEVLVLTQLGGVHSGLTRLMEVVPAERAEDFDAALTRLKTYPDVVDQHIALLKRGLELGVTPPRVTLVTVPDQIDALLTDESIENPILAPFRKDAPLLSEAEREAYREKGVAVLKESVLPALRKFRAFVTETYLPGARETISMAELPDGEAWYAFSAKASTTTSYTPEEIHRIGLREVERIGREMEAVIARAGFEGDRKAFEEFLLEDPKFFAKTPEELLAGYRDIAKRADAELPRLFSRLPELPYGVRAIPDFQAPASPTAYYYSGSMEAGRAGYFMANTSHLDKRPKWQMEALTLHEAVPGHHLQIALAKEVDDKPDLLRERGYTAFGEGWGLYAESLGKEMGFYTDPYSDYGRLTFEIWRACRLVVDTGMHALGWTRQQAIDFMRENTAMSDHDIKVEVDRYIVWPGQALAYKMGELKIQELRRRAEEALGDDFDIRAFHDVVLGAGGVPLDVLEVRVDEWIARRKGAE
jgi:Uncharacterized protein conserved in bacteria